MDKKRIQHLAGIKEIKLRPPTDIRRLLNSLDDIILIDFLYYKWEAGWSDIVRDFNLNDDPETFNKLKQLHAVKSSLLIKVFDISWVRDNIYDLHAYNNVHLVAPNGDDIIMLIFY